MVSVARYEPCAGGGGGVDKSHRRWRRVGRVGAWGHRGVARPCEQAGECGDDDEQGTNVWSLWMSSGVLPPLSSPPPTPP
jgi:hypothetical protein